LINFRDKLSLFLDIELLDPAQEIYLQCGDLIVFEDYFLIESCDVRKGIPGSLSRLAYNLLALLGHLTASNSKSITSISFVHKYHITVIIINISFTYHCFDSICILTALHSQYTPSSIPLPVKPEQLTIWCILLREES
jgi:hypothetical protein